MNSKPELLDPSKKKKRLVPNAKTETVVFLEACAMCNFLTTCKSYLDRSKTMAKIV